MQRDIQKTKRWQKKRQHILLRDKFLCQHFLRFGKRLEANTVHHIYPVELYPQYAFCDWNLISLSNKAHNMMHVRDSHELTAEGKRLMQKTIPPTSANNILPKGEREWETLPTLQE